MPKGYKMKTNGDDKRPTSEQKYGKRLRGKAAKKAIALGQPVDAAKNKKMQSNRPTSSDKYGGTGFKTNPRYKTKT